METYFINRSEQALILAKSAGPECGVCLDTFHLNIEEKDPYQAIVSMGDRLVDFMRATQTGTRPGWAATIGQK